MTDHTDATITWVVFTYNEAARIERVVRNLRASGPVLVVDNYSADDTCRLAESLGARILLNKNPGWVEDEDTARAVKAAVQTPWIYWGYADEMMSPETIDHLKAIVSKGHHDVVSIGRRTIFMGASAEMPLRVARFPGCFEKMR